MKVIVDIYELNWSRWYMFLKQEAIDHYCDYGRVLYSIMAEDAISQSEYMILINHACKSMMRDPKCWKKGYGPV